MMLIRVLLVAAFLLALVVVQPVAAASAAAPPTWHVVVRGETLFSIGRLYDVNPWAIASANHLGNPHVIHVGQRLHIPAGPRYPGPRVCDSHYTVQRGDTLIGIGLRYKVSPWSIASANRIRNVNRILVGQRLSIPCH